MSWGEALLNVVGNFADNLTGGWLSGPSRDEERQRIATARMDQDKYAQMQANQLDTNIRIGKQYGLDPLAVLGTNQGSVTAGSIGATPMPQISQSQHGFGNIQRDKMELDMMRLQKEGLELDNLKKMQNLLPPDPQPNVTPVAIKEQHPARSGYDPTGSSFFTYATMPNGMLKVVPSAEIKELIEDSPAEWEHYIQTGILDRFGHDFGKPKIPAGEGKSWHYNQFYGAWERKPNESFVIGGKNSELSPASKFNQLVDKGFGTQVLWPLGKSIKPPASGLNPNSDYDLKKHGYWEFDKKTKMFKLIRRR